MALKEIAWNKLSEATKKNICHRGLPFDVNPVPTDVGLYK